MAPILILGPLEIPTYFLILSAICSLGVFVLPNWAGRFGLSEGLAANLYILILLSGFLGARVFHVLLEGREIYSVDPLRIFFIWDGGFVFLGSVLFALVASWFWLKKKGEDFFLWADVFAPWLALGYGLGRIACFFNGCCYGKECYLPWAVKFPSHMFVIEPFVTRHPTQLYAAFAEVLIFVILYRLLKKRKSHLEAFKNTGTVFVLWLCLHGVTRFVIEQLRDDDRGEGVLGLSPSSLISVFLVGLGIMIFVMKKQKRHG